MKNGRAVTLIDKDNKLSLSKLTESHNVNGRIFSSLYQANTRLGSITSPAGRVVTTTHDLMGRPILRHVAGLVDVNYTYDGRGRLTGIAEGVGADARSSTLAYGANGYLASMTDALGRQISFEQDAVGRVIRQLLPDGREIRNLYDSNGNKTVLFPPGTSAHVFQYDALDQEKAYLPPGLEGVETVTRYQYSLDKELLRVIRPDGQEVGLNYDSGGRLSSTTIPQGDYQYSYDLAGRLGIVTAPDGGTLTYGYDGSLLLSSAWSGVINGTVTHAYDNNFRMTNQTVNGGYGVAYGYDPDGLVISAGEMNLARDTQNGLLTGTTLGGIKTQYTRNVFGETSAFTATYNGSVLLQTNYQRDKLGRMTQKTETQGGQNVQFDYVYDLAGRLTEVRRNGILTAQYAYDANSNRLSRIAEEGTEVGVYDMQDRLLKYGDVSYTYTANGELLTRSVGGQTTRYNYDVLGNLRAVALPDGTTIDYVIDGQNRRIGRKVNGTLVQGFLYQDALNPIAELDGNGTLVTRFVYGTKTNVPDYMLKGSQIYRILSDHLGSPRLVVNNVDGSIVQKMDFDEYGQVILDTNPGFQPFGFAGGLYDPQTGLVRFGARDYDAYTGRWTAIDPIRFDGGDTNLYRYVGSDPINWTDPDGLSRFGICHITNVFSCMNGGDVAGGGMGGGGGGSFGGYSGGGRSAANRKGIGEGGPIFVNPQGIAVPTPAGGTATCSPKGDFIQARNPDGSPNGVRLDGPHSSHNDPRAQQPHAHIPGRTNVDGTPWLPVR